MRILKSLLVVLITVLTFSVGQASPPIIENLQKSYTSQIGVREATGRNDGREVEMYLQTVGLGKGYAWCAAFVKWNLLQVGITKANRINGMALSCHNSANIIYYKNNFLQPVQPGDIFTIYYSSLKRIGHTGFLDKAINSSIYRSVEGNTNAVGSREGDGVYYKYRSYKATYSITRWV